MRAIRPDGLTVDYFGSRDDAGNPISLEYVNVTDTAGDTTSITIVDQKPSTIQTEDGTILNLIWLSDTEFRLQAISPDGQYEASIPVDLENPEASVPSATPLVTSPPVRAACIDATHTLRLVNYEQDNDLGASTATNLRVGQAGPTIDVDVSKCSQPYDPGVVKVRFEGFWLGGSVDYFAQRIDTGTYQARIPDLDRDAPIGETCAAAVKAIDTSCIALRNMTPVQITALCVRTGAQIPNQAARVAVTAGCEAALLAARAYCNLPGRSPAPGAPSGPSRICEGLKNFEQGPETVTLTPHAYDSATTQWLFGSPQAVPSQGPFPTLSLAFSPSATSIESVATFPLDPTPDMGYTVSAFIFPCLTDTSGAVNVTISVSGTDGYQDSHTVAITEEGEVSLSVPGGAQNVRDTITVSVEGGSSKTFSIVF
jgi:hypothetical protein